MQMVLAGVDMEKLGATTEVWLTAGVNRGNAQIAIRKVMKSMTESKEFSLGKRMPDKGGVEAWGSIKLKVRQCHSGTI